MLDDTKELIAVLEVTVILLQLYFLRENLFLLEIPAEIFTDDRLSRICFKISWRGWEKVRGVY